MPRQAAKVRTVLPGRLSGLGFRDLSDMKDLGFMLGVEGVGLT